MKMIKDIDRVRVKFNKLDVGYLVQQDSKIHFQYSEEWLHHGFSVSPFSLPLKKGVFTNEKNNFDGLFGVFANSLPDGWGQFMMIKRLAKEGIDYERLAALTKLTLVGNNVKGGLTYEPSQTMNAEEMDDLDQLAIISKDILEGKNIQDKDLDELTGMMGSSGGARPKAYINRDGKEWIVKFPGYFDSKECGKEEFVANDLALRCGLKVNGFRLFESKRCSGYFGAERFDRDEGKRIHMVSLSALLETSFRLYNLDYLHLLKVAQTISDENEDLYEAYGRMCFNVLYGNKDDHGNNFSFLYDETNKTYRLSPFYDITKTPDIAEHSMTVMGKGDPSETDLLAVAEEISLSIPRCQTILRKIKGVLKN